MQKAQPVAIRQAEIEQDQVEISRGNGRFRLGQRTNRVETPARFAHRFPEQGDEADTVLDEEKTH